MTEWFRQLLTMNFPARGEAFQWKPYVVWPHVLAECALVGIFLVLFIRLVWFAQKRQTGPLNPFYYALSCIFLAVSMLLSFQIWSTWHGQYGLEAVIKVAAAILCLFAGFKLLPQIPRLIGLPRLEEFKEITKELENQIGLRRGLEELHKDNEMRFKKLLEATPDSIVIINKKGRIVTANAQAEKMFGYSQQELLDKSMELLVPDYFRDTPENHKENPDDSEASFDLMGQRRDGSRFPVDISLSPLETGREDLLISMIRDVSERKKDLETLRASESHFRALIENALDVITILKQDGVIQYESPSLERVLGYPKGELLGKSIFDFIHPDDLPRIKNDFALRPEEERRKHRFFEFRFRHHNGQWHYLEAVGKNLLADPIVKGIIVHSRDITSRKQAEEEIRFLPQIMQAISESHDLQSALQVALSNVCEITHWTYAEAWIPREDLKVLRCSPAWWGEAKKFEKFRTISEELRYPTHTGLQGRVWASRKPEWIRDISQKSESDLLRIQMLKELGFKSALGVPIVANDKVLAVLVFLMLETRETDERLVGLISTVAAQLGSVIQRKFAEEALRQAHELLEKRILERTEELAKTNMALESEIAERRMTTQALLSSQKKYERLMNSLDGIVWEADPRSLQFSFVSEQAERILGYPVAAWRSEPGFWRDHIHGGDREAAVSFHLNTAREKKEGHFEYRMISADGKSVWLRDMVSVVVENDQTVKLRGVMVDITERKQMEETLQDERNFASAILETAGALVIVLNPDAHIVRFNRAFEQVTGYSSEVMGKPIWDLFIKPDELEQVKNIFSRLLAGQFPSSHESDWVAKDGSRRVIAWTNTVILNKSGQVEHVIGTGIDITKHKQAEEKLKQAVADLARTNDDLDRYSRQLQRANERLKKLDEMKSNFISSASHELRTPLTSIKGYVETILQNEVGPINDKQKEFLSYVKQSTDRLNRLLNELLDISRIESGQVRMNLEVTDLSQLLKNEVDRFKPEALKKEVLLHLDVEERLIKIECDQEKIKEAVDNLIHNAIKYTPRKGQVRVIAKNLKDWVQIDIRDMGPGIKQDDQSKIFEPFQYLASVDEDNDDESTGLGLMLVKKIVEAHGGEVSMRSEEGEGTTFTLLFPSQSPMVQLSDIQNNDEPSVGRLR
jgi:PAS domain S-box-containing protein